MFKFDVRLTGVQQTVDRLNRLQRDLGDKVIVAALNETIDQAKTQISRRIREEFNISASLVRERLQIRRASRAGYRFTATLIGNPAGRARRAMNIIHFVTSADRKRGGGRRLKSGAVKQLGIKIKRTGGKTTVSGAFIGNKGRTVFRRVGEGRLPIVPVQTIDIPQMFQTKRVQQPVQKWIVDNFPRIFDSRMRYYLSTMK